MSVNEPTPTECPKCHRQRVARICYGFPSFSDELNRDLAEGRITLGGCTVDNFSAKWQCLDCAHCGCVAGRVDLQVSPRRGARGAPCNRSKRGEELIMACTGPLLTPLISGVVSVYCTGPLPRRFISGVVSVYK